MSNPTERFESQLADLLIDKIKQLQTDWKKPWFETTATIKNIQGRAYAGSNSMLLRLICDAAKWEYPVFATFKMAKDENVSILKGSKSIPIIFHKESYKHKDLNVYISPKEYEALSEQAKQDYSKKVLTTYANVFNIAQTNIKEVRPDLFEEITKEYRENARDLTNSEENRIDELVRNQAWFCPIKTDLETGAHYNLKTNEIHITPKSRFLSDGLFHSTLLHEMTHSTGHSDLLDRLTPTHFGSPEYGREELVAELGSALTGAHYNLPVSLLEDHAAYLKAWLKTLKEEPEFLHTVLGDASKASRLTIQRIDSQEQYITTEQTMDETNDQELSENQEQEQELSAPVSASDEETQEQEEITVNNEVLPYAELYAHEENMTTAYITEKGLNLPDEVRSEIHARDSVLLGLEMNNMPELEPEMLRRKFELEDSIREKLGNYLSSEYGFTIASPFLLVDKEKALSDIHEVVTDEKSPERLMQDGLNDRLEIDVERNDTPEERAELEANDTEYEVTPDGHIKTKGVARIKEGYSLPDTPKNRAYLAKNEISFSPISGKRLFVSMRSQKVALLLASSFLLTPIVGVAVMYAMNRTRSLDRLLKDKQFNPKEADLLNNGQTIKKQAIESGRKIDKYYFVDKDTNRLRSIPAHEVHLPNRVYGVELSVKELDDLRNGKTVIGYDEKSKLYFEARLDFNNKQNVQMGFKQLKADKEYKAVPTPNSPDQEKIEYVQVHGAQGVNDIWDRGGVNLERDSFLDKYDVGKFYRGHISASQQNHMDLAGEYSQSIIDKLSEGQQMSIQR